MPSIRELEGYNGGDSQFQDPEAFGFNPDGERYYWTRPEGAYYMALPLVALASLIAAIGIL